MITNDRQYRLSRSEAERFRTALQQYDTLELVKQGIDPLIIEAQRRGLEQQLRELERNLARYEALRSGEQELFTANALSEIGDRLIEGRVAQGLTQRDLAVRLGMREQQVQRYEHERYHTANLSRIAEVAQALQLAVAVEFKVGRNGADRGESAGATAFDPRKLPIKQMKKRGWLDGVRLDDLTASPSDVELAAAFIAQAAGANQLNALHRQNLKLGAKADPYSLLAWKARVLERARRLRKEAGALTNLDPIFISKLVRLSQSADGIVEAVKLLRGAGVLVVFEEHLPSTYLDGAALLLDNALPVLAMTLRHDRLDNFWFVLFHELGHIVRHRDSGLRDGFFDDDSVKSIEHLENEADEFAIGALIPDAVWKNSFVRFTKNRDEVIEFAGRVGVGVPVVAGRIRNERKDYSLFSDLVGNGEVRTRISEAGFMD